MSKHTPGPWEWSDKYRTSDNKRNTWSLLGKDGYGILSCDGDANSPQSLGASGEANARLIAAAPELLEALQMARTYMKYPRDASDALVTAHNKAIYAVDAAIAKATGATHE